MLRTRVIGLSLGSALLAISSQALALPAAMSAVYDVYRNDTSVGYLQSSLKYTGAGYEYHKSTQATGLAKLLTKAKVVERSTGQVAGHQLIPQTYLYDERTRKKTRVEQARFSVNQATGIYKDKAYSVATPGNVMDRGSLELAVARDLKRALPSLVYPVMERGEIKTYTFTRSGNEMITTPAGQFMTIKLTVQRTDSDRKTVYWMAKEMDYLPAKMLHQEKGDVIRSDVRQYSRTR